MNNQPIGVMDSGLGGLSVVRLIQQQLPNESIVFVGDEGHFPYGTKPQAEVRKFVLKIGEYFEKYPVKLMVIACNTATAAALAMAKKELSIPVLGVIHPGAQAAVNTNAHTIGVIGTDSTIKDGAYEREIHKIDPTINVISKATQPLVSIVEHGLTNTPQAQRTVNEQLSIFDIHPVDALILGCTHFPFLRNQIQNKVGEKTKLVDPAKETINYIQTLLKNKNMLSDDKATYHLYSTGNKNTLIAGANKWLHGNYTSCESLKL
ncbi:glutamate racemase [Limosilactobacillus reuteri]|uniref:Glutamate racemase n=1 Tax=Limosilactobacillus reuteri TaxID=1598 RepID=A0A1C2GEA6_LIMRT|nr:glutamate racemase [Limosilactobacillus reuteri]OCX49783.1 glutamate racemase [Limosilactobacillus reuteri]WPC94390.1 glutamate racemase [Limosilactobacillus reuteri]